MANKNDIGCHDNAWGQCTDRCGRVRAATLAPKTLSTGTVVTTANRAPGCYVAFTATGDEMTSAEWHEYCTYLKGLGNE